MKNSNAFWQALKKNDTKKKKRKQKQKLWNIVKVLVRAGLCVYKLLNFFFGDNDA
ncbi:hypothetical protein ACVQFP_004043 [Yersinia enterocolitica]|uniref:Uncharacterized protein n=3 Tax=root TaxID=1 RepID=A0AAE9FLG5_9CAUD|nr:MULTISPECIES: hypothetical protein [Yersinia]YP_010664293.1 hypothetical protein PQA67_gp33 [Yersinia phage vB_YenM_56.17]EKN3316287.1 hypothetical protein [Yersinia enterocolitica]EKN3319522.1 hypothetical protein [Yersinia enterocolitica]EKN3324102.1 hypothetical protein [Yersinia enterocolitica]EKN3336098.1 hypothetical protein [Yersinia enterocolitica]EKN3356093.1 hypothetical protein [Yersinia enterocolitica]